MPIQGFTRFRKHQFGRQAALGTKVAAKRAYAFRGVPSHNLNWTDPDVDVGSLDPVAAPYRGAPDLTAPLTTPSLHYNDLPLLLSAVFGDAVTPTGGGTAKTWVFAPASTTADAIDTYTYEFGDDVLTDWFQYGDVLAESIEISGSEGLGPLEGSFTFRMGSIASSGSTDAPDSPTVPTSALNVEPNEAIVYLKDGAIYIADDPYDLDAGQIADALHSFTLRINQPWDEKRFANGSQTFDVDGYGRGAREIQLEATYAKTTDTVGIGSESDAWMKDEVENRYIQMRFTSTVEAETAIPNSWVFAMPARYFERVEGEIGGNTVVILTAHAWYDADEFSGVFTSTVINTLANAAL